MGLRVLVAHERAEETRPFSIATYAQMIETRLEAAGVTLTHIGFEDCPDMQGYDLLWAPGLGSRRVPKSLFEAPIPALATIHGIQNLTRLPMIREEGLRRGLGMFRWRRQIRAEWRRLRARDIRVISVSQTLSPEITHGLYVPPEQITVIPHGVAPEFFAAGREDAERGGFFHISQYDFVKNIPRILEAYERSGLSGSEALEIISLAAPAGLRIPEGVCLSRDGIPHAQVAAKIGAARALIFPSLSESFGLPVLEAMAAGTPVITSKGTGAAETAGGAALLVDPTSVEEIAEAMIRIAEEPELRAGLRAAGIARARDFSWDAAAAAHLALFEEMAG